MAEDTYNHDVRSGLGLGLFIVREIARAHGGEVEVLSDRGETTFAVRLPRRPSAEGEEKPGHCLPVKEPE